MKGTAPIHIMRVFMTTDEQGQSGYRQHNRPAEVWACRNPEGDEHESTKKRATAATRLTKVIATTAVSQFSNAERAVPRQQSDDEREVCTGADE